MKDRTYYKVDVKLIYSDSWKTVFMKDSLDYPHTKTDGIRMLKAAMKQFHAVHGRLMKNGTRCVYECEYLR